MSNLRSGPSQTAYLDPWDLHSLEMDTNDKTTQQFWFALFCMWYQCNPPIPCSHLALQEWEQTFLKGHMQSLEKSNVTFSQYWNTLKTHRKNHQITINLPWHESVLEVTCCISPPLHKMLDPSHHRILFPNQRRSDWSVHKYFSPER